MKTLTLVAFLAIPINSFSQGCGAYPDYLPNNDVPIITYNINIHVLNDDNGDGIYSQFSAQDFSNQIDIVNQIYQYLQTPSIPVNPPASYFPDAKIRFLLKQVTFHNNTAMYNSTNVCGNTQFVPYGTNTTSEINVFYFYNPNFVNNPSGCASMTSMFVNMFSFANLNWVSGQMLAHELGHCLSLPHTWTDSYTDTFAPDDNTSWLSCNNVDISNNIMGYNTCRSYLSPMQLGQVRYFSLVNRPNFITITGANSPCTEYLTTPTIWNMSKEIICNTTVSNSATLTSNCNIFLAEDNILTISSGNLTSNNDVRAFSGSEIHLTNGSWNCNDILVLNNSHVYIGAGGVFNINSAASLGNSSYIHVESGGTVMISSGATLTIFDGCRLIVENGGTIIYNGGELNLPGNNSVVEIAGDLQIADNITFTFIGAGYLRFSDPDYPSTNINPGTNSKIWLNGSGTSDKVLEISQETMYAHGLAEFKLTNGKAELHENSRISVDGPVVFNIATVTSNTGAYNAHRGLALYGQNGVSITSSSFKYGKYGIYALLSSGNYGLTISYSFFDYNDYGLVTVGKYANLTECSFNYNSFGWQAIGMTQSSTASICYFQYNLQGIKYEFSSTSGLLLNTTRVKYNEFLGVECSGLGTLTLYCSNVSFNDYSGVLLHHGASLNMSPS